MGRLSVIRRHEGGAPLGIRLAKLTQIRGWLGGDRGGLARRSTRPAPRCRWELEAYKGGGEYAKRGSGRFAIPRLAVAERGDWR